MSSPPIWEASPCWTGFERRIDRSVLPFYFTHGYIPAPYSIYENIRKLPAGCLLTIRAPFQQEQEPAVEPYWSMREAAERGSRNPFAGSRQEAADELERLLKESIKGQMVADVPVGAFLSAGIDSSTIVSLMQSLAPGKVRTFTIGMEKGNITKRTRRSGLPPIWERITCALRLRRRRRRR